MIGTSRFLKDRGINVPEYYPPKNNTCHRPNSAEITTFIGVDGVLQGWITFEDKLKEESVEVVKRLKEEMVVKRVILLSGDSREGVKKVADMLGITEWVAECLPHEKSQFVENLTRQGRVLFVGDGINDASSVAVAHVGIAMATSNDEGSKWTENITSATSDVTIMSGDLLKVLKLMTLGRRVMSVAKQSAIGGISLSVLAMIVATQGVVAPTIGALIQEVIDVVTILNALRIVAFTL